MANTFKHTFYLRRFIFFFYFSLHLLPNSQSFVCLLHLHPYAKEWTDIKRRSFELVQQFLIELNV